MHRFLAVPLVLFSLLLHSSLAAAPYSLPPHLSLVDNISDVHCPTPSTANCTVGYDAQQGGATLLNGKRVVLLVGTGGASAEQVATVYQYYVEREATVSVYCTALDYPIVFTDLLCPRYSLANPGGHCLSVAALAAEVAQDAVDVLVVPGGYDALLALREDVALIQTVLIPFGNATRPSVRARVLMTVEEGLELLVTAGLLFNASEEGILPLLPATTPLLVDALATQCEGNWRLALCGGDIASNCSQKINSSVLVNVGRLGGDLSNVFVAAASSSNFLNPLLVAVSRTVFQFNADLLPTFELPLTDASMATVNCTAPSSLALKYPPVTPTLDQLFAALPVGLTFRQSWGDLVNTPAIGLPALPPGAYNYSADLARLRGTTALSNDCLNAHGIDLCRGEKMAVVVAHGTHDAQLVALLGALDEVGVQTYIYCPDRDLPLGIVYTAPYPAIYPSFAVQCTNFYNETFIELANHIIVPGGAVATHRRLRNDLSVSAALLNRNAFGLYGSALILLPQLYELSFLTKATGVSVVTNNNCPYAATTDLGPAAGSEEGALRLGALGDDSYSPISQPLPAAMPSLAWDLTASGFNVSSNASFVFVQYEEESTKRKRKQFAGYSLRSQMLGAPYDTFLRGSVTSFVFDNAVDSTMDRLVGAILLSVLGAIVAAVVASKCVRRKGKSRSAYASLSREEMEVESL